MDNVIHSIALPHSCFLTHAYLLMLTHAYSLVLTHSLNYLLTHSLDTTMKMTVPKSITTAVVAILLGGMGSPMISHAYGNAFEVIDPKDAIFNDETKNSDDVKAGVRGLKEIQSNVQQLINDIKKDNQINLTTRLSKDLNVGYVRNTLNKFNSAFSEDTQRGTDRLIRAVVQDIEELESKIQVKPGKERSEVRVNLILKRLQATSDSLDTLSKFNK